jgi:hypothetical protein
MRLTILTSNEVLFRNHIMLGRVGLGELEGAGEAPFAAGLEAVESFAGRPFTGKMGME